MVEGFICIFLKITQRSNIGSSERRIFVRLSNVSFGPGPLPAGFLHTCSRAPALHSCAHGSDSGPSSRKGDASQQRDWIGVGACVRSFICSASPPPCLSGAAWSWGRGRETGAVGEGCADAVTLPISQSPLLLATEDLHERTRRHMRARRACHQPFRRETD